MRESINLFVFLCFSILIHAQDPRFSQFYNDRLLTNPALSGLDEGLSVSAQGREQWFANWPNRFQTVGVCIECRFDQSGTGISFSGLQDREGGGVYTTQIAGLTLGQLVPLGKNQGLHLGLSSLYTEKFLDFSKMLFSDQISAFTTQLMPDLVNLPATSAELPMKSRFLTLGAGVVFRGSIPIFKSGGINRNPFFSAGLSIHNTNWIVRPEESLLNNNKWLLPRRFTLHTGYTMPFPKSWIGSKVQYWNWTILTRAMFQSKLNSFSFGFHSAMNGYGCGLLLQRGRMFYSSTNANAFTLLFSREWMPKESAAIYQIELSYDVPTGHVGTQTGGGIECSYRMRFANKCVLRKKQHSFKRYKGKCPKLDDATKNRLH
jgi:type IX secretion system PorP/SprF family membrane protein